MRPRAKDAGETRREETRLREVLDKNFQIAEKLRPSSVNTNLSLVFHAAAGIISLQCKPEHSTLCLKNQQQLPIPSRVKSQPITWDQSHPWSPPSCLSDLMSCFLLWVESACLPPDTSLSLSLSYFHVKQHLEIWSWEPHWCSMVISD